MREILFRGKRVDNGEWVEGLPFGSIYGGFFNGAICAIRQTVEKYGDIHDVVIETVGQYTGLTDKNGKKIFEGDIVVEDYGWKGLVEFFTEDIGSCGCCVPQFDGSGFKAKYKNLDSGVDMRSCTIVGNIYDNPEMWEEEE